MADGTKGGGETDQSHRLNQLHFLLEHIKIRTEIFSRISNLLIAGNTGAIVTSLILLKEFRDQFIIGYAFIGIVLFVVGLIGSGFYYTYGVTSWNRAKNKTLDLALNDEDIRQVRPLFDQIDDWHLILIWLVVSIFGFAGGIVLLTLANLISKN